MHCSGCIAATVQEFIASFIECYCSHAGTGCSMPRTRRTGPGGGTIDTSG